MQKDLIEETPVTPKAVEVVVNPQDSLEVDEDGLKTFVNDASGVSFKFPADKIVFWSVDWENLALIPAGSDSVGAAIVENTNDFFAGKVEATGLTYIKDTNTEDWIKNALPSWITPESIVEQKKIKFKGKSATQLIGPGDSTGFFKVVLVEDGANLIVLREDRNNDFLNKIFNSIEFGK